jgi:hypothetical protein|nr:MAG TPA: hypothetical protein [Caudoviricetes sp.]
MIDFNEEKMRELKEIVTNRGGIVYCQKGNMNKFIERIITPAYLFSILEYMIRDNVKDRPVLNTEEKFVVNVIQSNSVAVSNKRLSRYIWHTAYSKAYLANIVPEWYLNGHYLDDNPILEKSLATLRTIFTSKETPSFESVLKDIVQDKYSLSDEVVDRTIMVNTLYTIYYMLKFIMQQNIYSTLNDETSRIHHIAVKMYYEFRDLDDKEFNGFFDTPWKDAVGDRT